MTDSFLVLLAIVCGLLIDCTGGSTDKADTDANFQHRQTPYYLGQWEEWSPCTVSCGSGLRSRLCGCFKPVDAPRNAKCTCGERNLEKNNQTVPCNSEPCPAVHGQWSDWLLIDECNVSCGEGAAIWMRECSNPAPQRGGNNCTGATVNLTVCRRPCFRGLRSSQSDAVKAVILLVCITLSIAACIWVVSGFVRHRKSRLQGTASEYRAMFEPRESTPVRLLSPTETSGKHSYTLGGGLDDFEY